MSTIEERVQSLVAEQFDRLYRNSGTWLIAFSGGTDSLALLSLAAAYRTTCPDLKLYALYVNHHLRDEGELQQELVLLRKSCARLEVPLQIADLKDRVRSLSQECSYSLEEAARKLRYEALEEACDQLGASAILTAHHQDDQIETLLMRFLKGSGLSGLSGIPASRGRIHRPLLGLEKRVLEEYLSARGLVPSHDSTNLSTDIERNAIRHQLIPLIRSIYPGFERSMRNGCEKLSLASDLLERMTGPDGPASQLVIEEHKRSVSLEYFRSLHPYQRLELLYTAGSAYTERQLPYALFKPLLGPIESNPRTIFVFDTLLCYLSKERIFWTGTVVHGRKNRYLSIIDTYALCLFDRWYLCSEEVEQLDTDAVCIPKRMCSETLVARSAEGSDQIRLRGGSKRVTSLFSEWKVPPENRWMIPIITDREQVLAVLGRAFGYRDRVCEDLLSPAAGHEGYRAFKLAYRSS